MQRFHSHFTSGNFFPYLSRLQRPGTYVLLFYIRHLGTASPVDFFSFFSWVHKYIFCSTISHAAAVQLLFGTSVYRLGDLNELKSH
jgi:hypothetical protein